MRWHGIISLRQRADRRFAEALLRAGRDYAASDDVIDRRVRWVLRNMRIKYAIQHPLKYMAAICKLYYDHFYKVEQDEK